MKLDFSRLPSIFRSKFPGRPVVIVLAALVVFLFIKEPKDYEESPEKKPGMLESLREILNDREKSGLRILLAIFFWFVPLRVSKGGSTV